MQGHNFTLMQAYNRLGQAGVTMYSVKTDCFTIPAESEAKAPEVLAFDQGSGTWWVINTEDIIFPFDTLSQTELDDIESKNLETLQLAANNEWDVTEACDHFEKTDGLWPGLTLRVAVSPSPARPWRQGVIRFCLFAPPTN